MAFLSFIDFFFTLSLPSCWELGLLIEEGCFPEMVSTIFIQQLLKNSVVSFSLFLRTTFSSSAILSLAMVPLYVKRVSLHSKMSYFLFSCYYSTSSSTHLFAWGQSWLLVKNRLFYTFIDQKFFLECHLTYKFLNLDIVIICLLSSFVINGICQNRIFHFFCGACLSVISLDVLVSLS